MKIIEQRLFGKSGDPGLCEDMIVVTANHVAVIDGATDKSGERFNGKAGGRFAAEVLAASFRALPADATIETCVAALTDALAEAVAACRRSALPASLPAASFVAYTASRREIWRVGDCCYRIGDVVNAPTKFIDYVNGWARKALLDALQLEGADLSEFVADDPSRKLITPILSRQHLFQNLDDSSPFAYGAIDGRRVPTRFLEVVSVDVPCEIVLTSDGYPFVAATFSESEDALARELASDPLRIGATPSTKGLQAGNASFDDRAYVRFSVG